MRALLLLGFCCFISELGMAQSSTSVGATLTTNTYQTQQSPSIGISSADQSLRSPVAYKYVDQMPAFPGDLTGFISGHLIYPDSAFTKFLDTKVIVQFMVKKDGTLSNIEIIKRVNPVLDKAVLQMVNQMPRWVPAKNKGEVVDAMFLLPIIFDPE